MHATSYHRLAAIASVVCLFSGTGRLSAQHGSYPPDPQEHPGRSYRTAKFPAHWGDTRVLKSVAGHTVKYAIVRYGIADIVKPADIERANREMYDFFSWKYGNPTLVASQWVTAGYQHFDHHADEAAAALLGMELPGPGPQVRFPKDWTDWLKGQVDTAASDSKTQICGGMGDTTYMGIACAELLPILRDAAQRAIDRLGISNAALIGKNRFDVTDEEIDQLTALRRHPVASAPGIKPLLGAKRRQ